MKQRTIHFAWDKQKGQSVEIVDLTNHLKRVAPNFQPNQIKVDGKYITFMGVENDQD